LARTTKIKHLNKKIAKLIEEMERLAEVEKEMLSRPEHQVSETDADARSMATSGRGCGMVGHIYEHRPGRTMTQADK